MSEAYDLYKEDENGDRTFVETVIGVHHLKKRLMKLGATKPGKYLVYDPTEAKFVAPFVKVARP
jgi:hypothetical protein